MNAIAVSGQRRQQAGGCVASLSGPTLWGEEPKKEVFSSYVPPEESRK